MIAKVYGQRPSDLLFPFRNDPNFALAIDNLIFTIGYKEEVDTEVEKTKMEIGHSDKSLELLIKALSLR